MIEGIPVLDAHVHAVRVPTLKLPWEVWAPPHVSGVPYDAIHTDDGRVDPRGFADYLDREGVDACLLMAEYSPRVTGIQPAEDMVEVVAADPARFGFIAAINPHVHFPVVAEFERQLDLGAVAVKVHPVHGGFPPDERQLYPLYGTCEERGVAVVVHCGTSNFPGASNRYADPVLLTNVVRDFPRLTLLLAHGGRGWSYDTAAFLALAYENVWIEISGLPPHRLPDYYARYDLDRLARRFVFGTDLPAVPGPGVNARRVVDLGLDRDVLEGVLWRNAARLYRLAGPMRARLEDAARG